MEETAPVEQGQSLEDRLAPQIERAKQRLGELDQRASSFIREHPVACLLGAVAFGYVIGKIASRNS